MRWFSRTLVLCFVLTRPAIAQSERWVVDPALSLAWWQINPHLNHLWATTCPGDPSWRPGEDRGAGWLVPDLKTPRGYAAIADTVVPLLPRKWALPLCARAVRGEIATSDASGWKEVRGLIVLRPDSLVTGLAMRDEYARKAVYESVRYPDIRFTIDSLTDIQPGDTLRATIVGTFEFRGVKRAATASAKAWRNAGGLRVMAQFTVVPRDLINVYGVSSVALGLGVGGQVWKTLHLGVDVVLKREGA
ncbi:MAG: YceI family protein [Gemmatimonadetes bacterium]|nr:YceI family protein [Gemmatimonadota bacterium]